MHEACNYVVNYNDIAVMQRNRLVAMEVCLEKKDTNKCDRDLTGMDWSKYLLNNKVLSWLVS
jgi:hypothetical protein